MYDLRGMTLERVIAALVDLYLIPPDFLLDPENKQEPFKDEDEERSAAFLVSSYFEFIEGYLKRRGLMK